MKNTTKLVYGTYVEFDHEPTREEVAEKLTARFIDVLLPTLIQEAYDEGRLVVKNDYPDDKHKWTIGIKLSI